LKLCRGFVKITLTMKQEMVMKREGLANAEIGC